jgi:hypothetical protein
MPLTRHLLAILLIMTIMVPISLAQTPAPLPLQVDLVEVPFAGPPALHSFAAAQLNGKWLFIGGRTNGIHSFDPLPINNFPLHRRTIGSGSPIQASPGPYRSICTIRVLPRRWALSPTS